MKKGPKTGPFKPSTFELHSREVVGILTDFEGTEETTVGQNKRRRTERVY